MGTCLSRFRLLDSEYVIKLLYSIARIAKKIALVAERSNIAYFPHPRCVLHFQYRTFSVHDQYTISTRIVYLQ